MGEIKSIEKIRVMKQLGAIHPELADLLLTLESEMVTNINRIAELEREVERLKAEAAEMTDGITYNLITHADLQRERDDARAEGRRDVLRFIESLVAEQGRDKLTTYGYIEYWVRDMLSEQGTALAPSKKEAPDGDAE